MVLLYFYRSIQPCALVCENQYECIFFLTVFPAFKQQPFCKQRKKPLHFCLFSGATQRARCTLYAQPRVHGGIHFNKESSSTSWKIALNKCRATPSEQFRPTSTKDGLWDLLGERWGGNGSWTVTSWWFCFGCLWPRGSRPPAPCRGWHFSLNGARNVL